MALRRLLLSLILLVCLFATPALALEVTEAWRSPLGEPRSVSVNPSDGSCWLAANSGVLHIAADGTILSQTGGFPDPFAVGVNPTDGSCWVIDGSDCVGASPTFEGAAIRLDESGAELLRVPYPAGSYYCCPVAFGVNPADGSCWAGEGFTSELVHLAQDGTELWRGSGIGSPRAISINPTDGSCWVAAGDVIHLAEDGTELWRGGGFAGPRSLSVNSTDGSCWVADAEDRGVEAIVLHLAEDGTQLLSVDGFLGPMSVSVDPTDGSCWVADTGNDQVVHLAEDGTELWRGGAFDGPVSVSVNPTDGSCWVADTAQVVHLSQDGVVLWSMEGFGWPVSVSVDSSDGSCWVGDGVGGWVGRVVHLAEDGTELWSEVGLRVSDISTSPTDGSCWVSHIFCTSDWSSDCSGQVRHLAGDGSELWLGTQFVWPTSVSVNPTDGSCWISDSGVGGVGGGIVRLAEDGTEVWRRDDFARPGDLSVNSADGSCWVAERDVIHLADDGVELWRGTEFDVPLSVSVNSGDGSCWVTDCNDVGIGDDSSTAEIIHLAQDGSELWRGEGPIWCAMSSVNSADGSCWIAAPCDGYVALLAEDGTELWRGENFVHPWGISVNPTDGSCWVADLGTSQVVHLVISLFRDLPEDHWAYDEIQACADAGIITGYDDGCYRPESPVSRDQMAVFIARALAGDDESIPDGPPPARATFYDVSGDHWAYKHVEYCAANGIVHGLGPGAYGPTIDVSRAQIAAFISRAAAGGDDNVPDGPAEPTFGDVPTDHWAYRHIEYCVANGIVEGYDADTYGPTGAVSRDQMAVFICRAFQLL